MNKPLLACLLVALVALSGCGGDPVENYCSAVKEHRKELNQMTDAGTEYGLITHLAMLRELDDAAPDDLADEWQAFVGAIEALDKAVKASGHKASDFDNAQIPADVSAADKAAIKAAADQLASQEVVAAAQGIDQQARDVCKVNLGR